ncbi:MAG: tRNA (adenosine(37)-N6)-threonylcarbamoyltransferase complex dimerization subunit type 1 TsaB [Thermoleophilia bacterium]
MILALETATAACSAALCAADGSVVAEAVALEGPAHTRNLLPGVHRVLEEAGAGWADVDTIAVGLGPGAFTGLRIGVATARALAHADGRARLAGVPTTAALALALAAAPEAVAAAAPGPLLVPLVDGKRREVFAAVYAADRGRLRLVEDVRVVPADELAAWLSRLGDVLVGGDGAALYAGLLPPSARRAAGVPAPTAAMVGRAVACGAPGLVHGPGAVLPLYGRVPDATPLAPARPPEAGASPVSAAAPASPGGKARRREVPA